MASRDERPAPCFLTDTFPSTPPSPRGGGVRLGRAGRKRYYQVGINASNSYLKCYDEEALGYRDGTRLTPGSSESSGEDRPTLESCQHEVGEPRELGEADRRPSQELSPEG